MKNWILFVLVFVILLNSNLFGEDLDQNVIVYEKTLTDGITATVYKSEEIRIVTKNSSDENLPKGMHKVTGEYIDQHFDLKLSMSDTTIWSYLNFYVKDSHAEWEEDYFKFFDIEMKGKYIFILYFYRSVYFEILESNNSQYESIAKQEITIGSSSTGNSVSICKLFANATGLYLNLMYVTGKRELWLLSTTDYDSLKGGPIVLWSNFGSKKGKEYESRLEYYNRLDDIEYNKNKEVKKTKKDETNDVNVTKKENSNHERNKSADSKYGNNDANGNSGSADNVQNDKDCNVRNDPDNGYAISKSTHSRSKTSEDAMKTSEGSNRSQNDQNTNGTDSTTIIWIAMCVFAVLLILVIVFRRK